MDGKSFPIKSTNYVPAFNALLAGTMPTLEGEVAVPEQFAKDAGMSNEEIIGKEISFSATMYNEDLNDEVPIQTQAVVTGVVDTTFVYFYKDEPHEMSIFDSFFFSAPTLLGLRQQAGRTSMNISLMVRPKSAEDMLSLRDELFGQGIVPSGLFTKVEDLLSLQGQAKEQTGSASFVIGI